MNLFLNYGVIWNLRNTEHFYFHFEIIDYLKDNIKGLPTIERSFLDYNYLFEKETLIFKEPRKMEEAIELASVDKLRSSILSSFMTAVRAASKSTKGNLQKSGKQLEFTMNIYKNINRIGKSSRTAYIINLLEDMEQPANNVAVRMIDQTHALQLLEETNEAFRELYNTRSKHTWNYKQQSNMDMIKAAVNHALKDILAELELLFESNRRMDTYNTGEEERLKEIIREINAILHNTHRIITYRKKAVEISQISNFSGEEQKLLT